MKIAVTQGAPESWGVRDSRFSDLKEDWRLHADLCLRFLKSSAGLQGLCGVGDQISSLACRRCNHCIDLPRPLLEVGPSEKTGDGQRTLGLYPDSSVTDNQYRSLPGDGLVAQPAVSVLALLQEEREEVFRKGWEMKAFRFSVNEQKSSLLAVSGEKKSSRFVVNGQKNSSLL